MKKIIILVLAAGLAVSFSGCQKIKRIFVKPPPEELVQDSYSTSVYAYESSVLIKASPREVIEHMVKDFSWLERASEEISGLQMEVQDLKPGVDMTEVGQSIGFNMKIMFVNFPCRLVTFKYKQDKELWLIAIAEGTWVLFRVDIKPVAEGSIFNIDIIIQLSPGLQRVVDFPQLNEAAASRIDLLIAFVQSEFDPDMDVKKATEKGLRGEFYQKFLQVHEAEVWVNASTEKTSKWVLENFDSYMPEMKVQGECASFAVFNDLKPDEVKNCPATYELLNIKSDMELLFTWRPKDNARFYRVYFHGLGQVGHIDLEVVPEAGGSLLTGKVTIEIPGPASPRIMDMMMALAAIPRRLGEAMMDVKIGVEGLG